MNYFPRADAPMFASRVKTKVGVVPKAMAAALVCLLLLFAGCKDTNDNLDENRNAVVEKLNDQIIIFNSGEASNGNFNRKFHQDVCNEAKASQSIRTKNVKPLIGRPGEDMKDIISEADSAREVIGPNGKKFKSDWSSLWTDTVSDRSLEAVGVFTEDHLRKYLPGRVNRGPERFWWSGSNLGGITESNPPHSISCSNWTSQVNTFVNVTNIFQGWVGQSDSFDNWVYSPTETKTGLAPDFNCVQEAYLLCVGY